jgi:type IV pilus assembly protein PilV
MLMHTFIRKPLALHSGFSLVEVMVAVLIISIGLLGIAKMEALSLSNTGNSRLRALAALQASSLASTMQADRNYWSTVPTATTPLTATVTGGAVTVASDGTLKSAPNCKNVVCTVANMAAFDLTDWAGSINTLIPSSSTALNCSVPAAGSPPTCTITVTWTENLVNANSAQSNSTTAVTALATPQYVMVVQP